MPPLSPAPLCATPLCATPLYAAPFSVVPRASLFYYDALDNRKSEAESEAADIL